MIELFEEEEEHISVAALEDVGEDLGQLPGHVRGDAVGRSEVLDRPGQLWWPRDRRLGYATASDLHERLVQRGSSSALLQVSGFLNLYNHQQSNTTGWWSIPG